MNANTTRTISDLRIDPMAHQDATGHVNIDTLYPALERAYHVDILDAWFTGGSAEHDTVAAIMEAAHERNETMRDGRSWVGAWVRAVVTLVLALAGLLAGVGR